MVLSYAFSCVVLLLLGLFIHLCNDILLRPFLLRSKLRKQGIYGPKPSLIYGSVPEIKAIKSRATILEASNNNLEGTPSLDYSSILFPHFILWTKLYGRIFTFAIGGTQILYVADPDYIRELNVCKSLDLGKPAYLRKERGPLLGNGVIAANHQVWSHSRKTVAPQLYMDKVKNMFNIIADSTSTLVRSWESRINNADGFAEISVDDYVMNCTSDAFTRILFGSNYSLGNELLAKCCALVTASESPTIISGLPFYRYLPTKKNSEKWRLKKEIHSLIMESVKKCSGTAATGMVQTLLGGSKCGPLWATSPDEFIVDNLKNLYLAASNVTANAITWALMLLASHPEWQTRARYEVIEVFGCDGMLDLNKLAKMKVLKMVIQEVLRLYPVVAFASREALKDIKLGKLTIPEGVNIWIWLLLVHRDTQLWGSDADKFNPERFANGILSASNSPQAYLPFGLGARICPGERLAMMEMKVVLATILYNFSFSLSTKYRHLPNFGLILTPKHGVDLVIAKYKPK